MVKSNKIRAKSANNDKVTIKTKIIGRDKFEVVTTKSPDKSVITTWRKNNKIHRDDDLPAIVLVENKLCRMEWFADGKNGRKGDKPSIIETKNGKLSLEMWQIDGKLHRDNGPALKLYDENGNLLKEVYIKNKKIHREDGPAIYYYKDGYKRKEAYFENNVNKNRHDLPNVIEFDRNGDITIKSWCIGNSELHRKGKPAIIYYKNKIKIGEAYYENGIRKDRGNLPNEIEFDQNGDMFAELWRNKNDKFHRRGKPAIIWYKNGHKSGESYYENGIRKDRGNSPNEIEFYENGNIHAKIWYDKNNKMHRTSHAAKEMFYETGELKTIAYFKHGQLHRIGGPAVIEYDKNGNKLSEAYFANGIQMKK